MMTSDPKAPAAEQHDSVVQCSCGWRGAPGQPVSAPDGRQMCPKCGAALTHPIDKLAAKEATERAQSEVDSGEFDVQG